MVGADPGSLSIADIDDDGDKDLVCGFMTGSELKTSWEVGDIHLPLSSVSKMVKAGNCVYLDTEQNGGCYVYNYKTGETMKIYEKNGIYVLPAWIKKPDFQWQAQQP